MCSNRSISNSEIFRNHNTNINAAVSLINILNWLFFNVAITKALTYSDVIGTNSSQIASLNVLKI